MLAILPLFSELAESSLLRGQERVKVSDFQSRNSAFAGKLGTFTLAQIGEFFGGWFFANSYCGQNRHRAGVAAKLHKTVLVYLAKNFNIVKVVMSFAGRTFIELL
jgi:hypothetical protein